MMFRLSGRWAVGGVAAVLCLLVAVGLAPGEERPAGRATDEAARKIAELFPLAQGVVLEVDGDRLLVDLGARRGAYEGMELEVYRDGEEVKHPVTGQLLGRREVHLAVIRIVEVRGEFSEASVVRREKEAKLSWGDSVRVTGDRITLALPLVEPGDVSGASVRSITKELAIALTKTGRFMVVEEHLIQASFAGERGARGKSLADPGSLKVIAEQLKAQTLVLGRLSGMDKKIFLDLQVLSTRSGATLGVASVAVTPPP